jgi:hypothetical protein
MAIAVVDSFAGLGVVGSGSALAFAVDNLCRFIRLGTFDGTNNVIRKSVGGKLFGERKRSYHEW